MGQVKMEGVEDDIDTAHGQQRRNCDDASSALFPVVYGVFLIVVHNIAAAQPEPQCEHIVEAGRLRDEVTKITIWTGTKRSTQPSWWLKAKPTWFEYIKVSGHAFLSLSTCTTKYY